MTHLGSLPAGHELELVGREERGLEADARALGALAQLRQVQHALVLATLHLVRNKRKTISVLIVLKTFG